MNGLPNAHVFIVRVPMYVHRARALLVTMGRKKINLKM